MLKHKNAQFSERMFEFAYNAEFCRKHFGVLAGAPHIPSQRLEKLLAYDVALRIKMGSLVQSVFLQHKVATRYWVPVGSTTKSHYSKFLGRRYFRFPLDNRQYNRIVFLRAKGRAIFYCAPKFASERRLHRAFLSQNLDARSIWIDVAGLPKLVGATFHKPHSMGYTSDESRVLRFSTEPHGLTTVPEERRIGELKVQAFDEEFLSLLYEDLHRALGSDADYLPDNETSFEPGPSAFEDLIAKVSATASQHFGLSWLLLPTST